MEGSATLSLPPGFRFHPTDEELITHYLTRKVSDYNFFTAAITEVDLTKSEPWDLPAKASMGEKEWYFFSLKDRKYPTGLRTNRATEAGYWKTTGRDKEIHHSGLMIGMKKTLVFYKGRAPKGVKTNWVMHEYRLQTTFYKPTKEQWVVCRVFQKSLIGKILTSSPSPLPALEESSDTNLANKLSDQIDHMSHLGSLVGFDAISPNDDDDKDINMNWGLTNYQSLVCPPSMLQSSALGAFQLDSYHPCKAISTSLDPFAAQSFECSGIDFSSNVTSSSSKNIDYVQNTFNEAFESVN